MDSGQLCTSCPLYIIILMFVSTRQHMLNSVKIEERGNQAQDSVQVFISLGRVGRILLVVMGILSFLIDSFGLCNTYQYSAITIKLKSTAQCFSTPTTHHHPPPPTTTLNLLTSSRHGRRLKFGVQLNQTKLNSNLKKKKNL